MEHAVKVWGQEVEEAAGPRIRRQERQREQRFWKEPGAGRESPQGLRAVARLVPGAGSSSSSEDVWEDAQTPGAVLTLKRLFWQEHGVERRSVSTQTDPVAIMSANEVLAGEAGVAEKMLAKELRRRPSCVDPVPEVEIRVDDQEPRVKERSREEPMISAEAKALAIEAGLAQLTRESVDRGWGRRVESVLGTVYEAAVPSFARFWE
jgi:hypothetical protein